MVYDCACGLWDRLRPPAHRARAVGRDGHARAAVEDDRRARAAPRRSRPRSRREIAVARVGGRRAVGRRRSACRAGSAASRTSRPPRSKPSSRALRSLVDVPIVLQDERLTQPRSREPARAAREGLAQAQAAARRGGGGRHPAGLPRRRSRAAPQTISRARICETCSSSGCSSSLVLACAGFGGLAVTRARAGRTRATTAAEQFVEIPQGAGTVVDRDGAWPRPASSATRSTFRFELARERRRAAAAGGRVPVRSADDRRRSRRQDRARRRLPAADHVPRRADDPADGASSSRARASGRRRSSSPPRRNAALDSATSIRRRAISRAICSRTPTRCRAARPPTQLVARMVAGFEKVLTPELRRAGRGARPERPRARHARVDRREGNRQRRTSGRSSRPSTRTGSRSAWGCSAIRPSSTRSSAPGATTATSRATTCSSTRPTTPTATPACRRGRSPSPGRASLEAAANPADVPYLYFVSRNDGSHAFADHARRAQSQRRRVPEEPEPDAVAASVAQAFRPPGGPEFSAAAC